MFAYCLNNPVKMSDEYGCMPGSFYMSDGGLGTPGKRAQAVSNIKNYVSTTKDLTETTSGLKDAVAVKGVVGVVKKASTFKKNLGKVYLQGKGQTTQIMSKGEYIDAGGINKQFAVGWAIDVAVDVVTSVISAVAVSTLVG